MYKFAPILRPMIWGRELWVLSGYPGRISAVSEGPDKGITVNELVARDKAALVGSAVYDRYGDEFPLLIKFIEAERDLSIQVHPDEAMAQRVHGGHGKTEMWYVLGTAPGAHLYSGLARSITPEEYERRVADDSIVDVLADHMLEPGDVFFLPAGRIHSICGGVRVAEIQQTSDLTYRIYDYGRPGTDGKPRQLHTALAKEAIDYKVYDHYKTAYRPCRDAAVQIASCEYFTTDVLDLVHPLTMDLSGYDSFVALMCVEGSGSVTAEGETLSISAGDTILVPAAATAVTFTPSSAGMKLLSSRI